MSTVAKALSRAHASIYRLSGGRVGARISRRAPVLVLTTTGRRSGKQRSTPLLYVQDGDDYVVVASVGGAPTHPAWYLNLCSDPEANVQVKTRRIAVRAETADPDERRRLWPKLTAMWPQYDDYQQKTEREIPVVVLKSRP